MNLNDPSSPVPPSTPPQPEPAAPWQVKLPPEASPASGVMFRLEPCYKLNDGAGHTRELLRRVAGGNGPRWRVSVFEIGLVEIIALGAAIEIEVREASAAAEPPPPTKILPKAATPKAAAQTAPATPQPSTSHATN